MSHAEKLAAIAARLRAVDTSAATTQPQQREHAGQQLSIAGTEAVVPPGKIAARKRQAYYGNLPLFGPTHNEAS